MNTSGIRLAIVAATVFSGCTSEPTKDEQVVRIEKASPELPTYVEAEDNRQSPAPTSAPAKPELDILPNYLDTLRRRVGLIPRADLRILIGTIESQEVSQPSIPASLHAEVGIATTATVVNVELVCGTPLVPARFIYLGGTDGSGRSEFTSQVPHMLPNGKRAAYVLRVLDGQAFLEMGFEDIFEVDSQENVIVGDQKVSKSEMRGLCE